MHNRIVRAATQRRIMFFFVVVFESRVNLKILKRNNIPKTKSERLKNLVLPEFRIKDKTLKPRIWQEQN